jgi:hypothetical protein
MDAGFARLDSKMDEGFVRLDAKTDGGFAQVDGRFARLERKLDQFIDLHVSKGPPSGPSESE